jgi:hypothetical protein
MVEDHADYETALVLDQRVWAVMPKIQARKARELLGVRGNSPEDLARCFGLKFHSEGHDFDIEALDGGVIARVHECHWVKLLVDSGREHLADEIGRTICATEGRVWAQEFGGEYDFELSCRICAGGDCCEYHFSRRRSDETGDES